MSCKLCAFFLPLEGAEIGLCRRYPPTVIGKIKTEAGVEMPDAQYPYVTNMNICGEYRVAGTFGVMHNLQTPPKQVSAAQGERIFEKTAEDLDDTYEKTLTRVKTEDGEKIIEDVRPQVQ